MHQQTASSADYRDNECKRGQVQDRQVRIRVQRIRQAEGVFDHVS
jgi:hypothetical protein